MIIPEEDILAWLLLDWLVASETGDVGVHAAADCSAGVTDNIGARSGDDPARVIANVQLGAHWQSCSAIEREIAKSEQRLAEEQS